MENNNDYLDLTQGEEDVEKKEEDNSLGVETLDTGLPTFDMPVMDFGTTDFQLDI